MAIKKIPCGGWSYDDSEIVFEDGVIHPIEKSELPEVTSADNGKVLGVVDGEWKKTEAGGGSGILYKHIIDKNGSYENWTAQDVEQVIEALENEKPVYILKSVEDMGGGQLFNTISVGENNQLAVTFSQISSDYSGLLAVQILIISSDGTISELD